MFSNGIKRSFTAFRNQIASETIHHKLIESIFSAPVRCVVIRLHSSSGVAYSKLKKLARCDACRTDPYAMHSRYRSLRPHLPSYVSHFGFPRSPKSILFHHHHSSSWNLFFDPWVVTCYRRWVLKRHLSEGTDKCEARDECKAIPDSKSTRNSVSGSP